MIFPTKLLADAKHLAFSTAYLMLPNINLSTTKNQHKNLNNDLLKLHMHKQKQKKLKLGLERGFLCHSVSKCICPILQLIWPT